MRIHHKIDKEYLAMAIGVWQPGDSLPMLPPLPSFAVFPSTDLQQIAHLNDISLAEAARRVQEGNNFYYATLEDQTVAYGWIATQCGGINELQFYFTLPTQELYLWDFKTFPDYRGRGIYPHFLQALLRQHEQTAKRFWIMYKPDNAAARSSIIKAGFHIIGDFTIADGHITGLVIFEPCEYADAAAEIFKLPIISNQAH
jgi:GNAT superfamily N-acetyltransferase